MTEIIEDELDTDMVIATTCDHENFGTFSPTKTQIDIQIYNEMKKKQF